MCCMEKITAFIFCLIVRINRCFHDKPCHPVVWKRNVTEMTVDAESMPGLSKPWHSFDIPTMKEIRKEKYIYITWELKSFDCCLLFMVFLPRGIKQGFEMLFIVFLCWYLTKWDQKCPRGLSSHLLNGAEMFFTMFEWLSINTGMNGSIMD